MCSVRSCLLSEMCTTSRKSHCVKLPTSQLTEAVCQGQNEPSAKKDWEISEMWDTTAETGVNTVRLSGVGRTASRSFLVGTYIASRPAFDRLKVARVDTIVHNKALGVGEFFRTKSQMYD